MSEFKESFIKTVDYQYGFRKNSSILSATINLGNYIATELDEKGIVIAFDVVNVDILFNKLENMGFRGVMHNLLRT